MKKGILFDIQRFSVHDGPGIRTTVFLKGCPLRCRWCHNPEGLISRPQLQFFRDQCLGCGACGDKTHLTDAERCPTGALKICGFEAATKEVLETVQKDRIFYKTNGGLTVSGGECLLQPSFVAELLSLAKAAGLHTAIDTCGCVSWSAFEAVLPHCDLFLYDIKCLDPGVHQRFTGVDNAVILENLRKLNQTKKEIWVRIPVIPGFNNDPKEMAAIADLVSSLPSVSQVTLMPYHTLGAAKYPTLGLEYPFAAECTITDAALSAFRDIFLQAGIHLQ